MKTNLILLVVMALSACQPPAPKVNNITLTLRNQYFAYVHGGELEPKVKDFFNGMMDAYDTVIIGYTNEVWNFDAGERGYIATLKNDTATLYLFRICRIYQKSYIIGDSLKKKIGSKIDLKSSDNWVEATEVRALYNKLFVENFSSALNADSHPTGLYVWVKLNSDEIGTTTCIKYFKVPDIYERNAQFEQLYQFTQKAFKLIDTHFKGSYEIFI